MDEQKDTKQTADNPQPQNQEASSPDVSGNMPTDTVASSDTSAPATQNPAEDTASMTPPPVQSPPVLSPEPSGDSANGPAVKPGRTRSMTPILLFLVIVLFAAIPAGAYYFYALSKDASTEMVTDMTETDAQPEAEQFQLTIDSPGADTLTIGDTVLVSGRTAPFTTVLIYTDEDETSVESDDQGKFSQEIGVTEGINTVMVTAFSPEGDEKTVTIDIVRDEG